MSKRGRHLNAILCGRYDNPIDTNGRHTRPMTRSPRRDLKALGDAASAAAVRPLEPMSHAAPEPQPETIAELAMTLPLDSLPFDFPACDGTLFSQDFGTMLPETAQTDGDFNLSEFGLRGDGEPISRTEDLFWCWD
jgi:hypothetical protein